MQALHNLCKMSKERQAEAAGAGVTQVLSQLAHRTPGGPGGPSSHPNKSSPPRSPQDPEAAADAACSERIRSLCIGLLCALAHSNSRTRTELWACQGLDLFVDLLREPVRCSKLPQVLTRLYCLLKASTSFDETLLLLIRFWVSLFLGFFCFFFSSIAFICCFLLLSSRVVA